MEVCMSEKNHKIDPLLRINQVLEIIPVGKSSWWAGVKSGRFPQPVHLGARTTAWKESEILELAQKGIKK
jgi:predicted DNA-binding transcriptional regulator AlpA